MNSARLPFFILTVMLVACSADRTPRPTADTAGAQFLAVMEELAAAWNAGDARKASECFTEDAVYSEPPDRQLYRGRAALFQFFGGDAGREGRMSMTWHHLAFSEETQVGFGEFSFTYGSTAHGVAVVKLRNGKISNWREYWYASDLTWDEFKRDNPF